MTDPALTALPAEVPAHGLVHQFGVGLALGRLHDRALYRVDCLFLAGFELGDRPGIRRQGRFDPLLQFAGVGGLLQSFAADDRRRHLTAQEHGGKYLWQIRLYRIL